MKTSTGIAIAAPSLGPAIVTVFGIDVPVMALCLSVAGLVLARVVAPPPLRKLSRVQEVSLTLLLLVVLFLIVTGELGGGDPLGPGMATVWGIGLGFSGLLAVEFFGELIRAMLTALMGGAK
ncbi:MAG: hypothetical protein CL555_05845 [Algoriphagus sp.]|nr:hypothetical protein [Algoriphagus sp.]